MKAFNSLVALLICIATAIIGYHVNVHLGSAIPLFWSVLDFFFWPFAWLKWLIFQEVNMTIIKEAFSFFLS